MTLSSPTKQTSDARMFELAKRVSVHLSTDKVHLVRHYPLKVLSLHAAWKPLFTNLKAGRSLSITQMADLIPQAGMEKLAAFMQQLEHRRFLQASGSKAPAFFPTISIIIPVRNRPREIQACLKSLLDLVYPRERLEIIVVDDASRDDTVEAASRYPVKVIALSEHQQASCCRNIAARQAKGDILAFIDSDCLAHPCWLNELVVVFEDPVVAAVGGLVDAYHTDKQLDLYEKVKSSLIISPHSKRTAEKDPFFYVPACNFLVRREAFLSTGGFDEHLNVGEDVDLCWRLQKQGHILEYRLKGTVYHKHRNTLWPFAKRRFQYGTSEPLLQKLHPEKIKQIRLPLPTLFFWASLLLGILAGLPGVTALSLFIWGVDIFRQKRKLGRLPVSIRTIALAVARGYGAAFIHWGAFLSRYYVIWALVMWPVVPLFSGVVTALHLLNSAVEYAKHRSGLNFPVFFFYFTVEQISYQSGVWWGCLEYRRMMPVNPKIAFGNS